MKLQYQTYKLKNGMQILLIKSGHSYSVDLCASSRIGGALETAKTQGLSHFVEHMALTATAKYPTKRQFSEISEFNGCSTNASTSKEFVSFTANMPYKKLDFGIELMHQILYHSTFNSEYLEKERSIILDEISKYENDVYSRNSNYINQNLLKNKSGYIYDVLGTKETVKNFTKRQLVTHYKKITDPANLLLTVSGNFDFDKAKKLIQDYFGNIPSTVKKSKFPDEEFITGKKLVKNDKKTDLIIHSTLYKGKDGISLTTYESVMIFLIRLIVTGTSTSRLFKRLREEEGLLYYVDSSYTIFDKFSVFEIYFEAPNSIYKKSLEVFKEEMYKLYKDGITEKELKHYKEYLINRNLIEFDNFHKNAMRIRNAVFYSKNVYSIEELNKTIKKFTVHEVNTYIKSLFLPKNASHVAYGNTNEETGKILNGVYKTN